MMDILILAISFVLYIIINELDKRDTKRELDALLKYLSAKQPNIGKIDK